MENNIEKLAKEYILNLSKELEGNHLSSSNWFEEVEFAYKSGAYDIGKQLFTFEDIKKAFIEGSHWKEKWNRLVHTECDEFFDVPDLDKYITSLQK